ncbi:hypothetical protein TIFTF001_032156 [Ficus carica]|uniref:Uncharacterized protein n=1 Tax=Ficus carica TaxID=3494 RepID=A0AA88DXZ2_FICCA|nr:hypothetical protein TIFTF001_032156 [Ficus carica]
MPHKASGETYVWDPVKEKNFLEKIDDYLAYSGGASGFGSVTMRDDSTPQVEHEADDNVTLLRCSSTAPAYLPSASR